MVNAPLVFAGYGITAPEYHYDDYKGIEATGRIVIVLRHEPQENDDKSIFEGRQLTSHAELASKATNAKNHGAVGIILVNDLGNHPGDPDELLRLNDISGPQEINIPIIQVKPAIIDEWLKPSGHTLDDLRQQIDKDLSNHSLALDPAAHVAMTVDIERIHGRSQTLLGCYPVSIQPLLTSTLSSEHTTTILALVSNIRSRPGKLVRCITEPTTMRRVPAECWNWPTRLAIFRGGHDTRSSSSTLPGRTRALVVSLLRESSSISNKANCCHDQHGYDRSRFEEQICQRHGNISGISEAGAGRKSCPEFRHQLF